MADTRGESFWKTPEGKSAIVVGVAALLGLYKALPYVNNFLDMLLHATQTTLGLALTLTGLVVFLWVITRKETWQIGWLTYKLAVRGIRKILIRTDPIGILRSLLDKYHGLKQNLETNIDKVRGTLKYLTDKLKAAEASKDESLGLAAHAQKEKDRFGLRQELLRAGRRDKQIASYVEIRNGIEVIYRVLVKMNEAVGFYIADIKDRVSVAEDMYEVATRTRAAVRSAKAIIKDWADRTLQEETLEFLTKDYADKMGEVESFMDIAKDFMSGIDLQTGAMEEKMLMQLKDWEARVDSAVLGDNKQAIIADARDESKRWEEISAPVNPITARRQSEGDPYRSLLR